MLLCRFIALSFSILVIISCSPARYFEVGSPSIRYGGRIDFTSKNEPVFVGSASFAEIGFKGDSCILHLKKLNKPGEPNYVSLELDGKYLGREKLSDNDYEKIAIAAEHRKNKHAVRIYKATEAQNGDVAFGGIPCRKLTKLPPQPNRKIEFIGNSITCGMGIDWKEIPCNTDQWYDQHNAFLAYGPQVARELDAQFLLSSVSGIGIYRNWNSLHPVMPEVYETLHLDGDDTKPRNFSDFTPDLVSICLGTNDFSGGDGNKYRADFDSAYFVSEYIDFVSKIYSHYPRTRICLLTSPMVTDKNANLFEKCLLAVKKHFSDTEPGRKEIALYFFKGIIPHGCGFHPDIEDQKKMAELLVPFYREVMDWQAPGQ